ncbi:MAG: tetratricopeptide repeat protein [Rhizomicrobium sp.]
MPGELFSQAVSLHQRGRLEDAGRLYLRMLDNRPADPEVRYLLAFLRYQQGRIGEALQAVEAALSRDPTLAKALLLHGILLHATGKPVEGLAQLTGAAARDPANAEIWYSRGVLLGGLGRHDEALKSFDMALSIRPTVDGWNNRGAALQSLKRWPEALQSFDAALALKPDHGQVWAHRGRVLQDMGRFEEAVSAYDRAVSLAPDFAATWNERGGALLQLRRFADSLASYDRALGIQADQPLAWHNRGTALLGLKRYEDALASYEKVLHAAPDYVPAIMQRAAALQSLYHLDEAGAGAGAGSEIRTGDPDPSSMRARALERLREAEAGFRQAVALNPTLVQAHTSLGSVLREQGKRDSAESSYRHAIALQADEVGAHIGLGNVLNDRGDLQGAIGCYRRALALNPNIPEAHNNLGNVLNDLGMLEEAMACYQQALALMPDLAQARNNIAVVLWNQGKLDKAESLFRDIIQRHPSYFAALDSLAALLAMQGNVVEATHVICRSLKHRRTQKAQRVFVDVIRNSRRIEDGEAIRTFMVAALTEPWGRPSDLAQVAVQLLKQDRHVGPSIAKAAAAWPALLSASELYGVEGPAGILHNPVLCALLNATQNPDVEMERFLTAARHLLLEAAMGAFAGSDEREALPFHCALAAQCFINEYVFSQSEEESRQVHELCARVTAALEAGAPMATLWVAAIAAYKPLGSVSLAARLLDRLWPEPLAALLAQQIVESQAEIALRAEMPRLTDIADDVSRNVRNLYEENPYPRWVRTPHGEAPNDVGAYLNLKFPLARFQRQTVTSSDVLIAGCGTGQHSIEVARRFRNAQVLAIDLSLSSLAYARRKSQELRLTNIAYGQADILELAALGRDFDLIEAAGVLHHMTDPYAAWGTLLSLLRPGGFMLVGLYSQVARRDIIRARHFIAARKFAPVPEQIRRCRQEIMALGEEENLTSLLKLSDFFSMSTCRDLLFHVQESYVTLAGIDDYLRAKNLTLLGFEINPSVLHAYRQRFPNDPAATNLAQWEIFERDNPDTFSSMYQFWIQKPA